MAILFVAILGASALLVRARDRRTAQEQLVAEGWRRFGHAAAQDDFASAEAALGWLAELTHHDASVEARLVALRSGEAAPGDVALARLLMAEHLRRNRWPDATREAAKVIEFDAGHMTARGLLARQCLAERQVTHARAHLAAIPSPFANADGATPGALLLIIGLKHEAGVDDTDLLAFIAARVLPILKARDVEHLQPVEGLQLLKCYHAACGQLDRFPHLAEYWVPAARLLSRIGNDPAQAATVALVREGHLAVVYRLRQTNALPAQDAAGLIRELEQQVATEWAAAQARDEREPLPYVGLALASHRRGNLDEARQWLERGVRASDNPRELYLALGRLLRANDPLTAGVYLEEAYQRFPSDSAIQQMLAELALAAGRPDRAREVCRVARAADPQARWAFRLEAAASLAMGRPTQALEALAPIRSELSHDPSATELYVRAASAVGAEAMVEDILRENPSVDAGLGAARGYLAARRPGDAVRWATHVIDRSPDHVPGRLVHAEALAHLAEVGDSANWSVVRVREALAAFEWLRQREPGDRQIAQRIAWLQLRGLDAPALALRSAVPLREPGAILTPEMNETLGAVLFANGDADEAFRCFDAALKRAPGRVDCYIGRAAALLQANRRNEATADLRRAAGLRRSPRQTAEWERVEQQLRGEK